MVLPDGWEEEHTRDDFNIVNPLVEEKDSGFVDCRWIVEETLDGVATLNKQRNPYK